MSRDITGKFVVDGQVYSSLEDMPPDIRSIYDENAAAMLRDDDINGVPDIFEGKGSTSEFSVGYEEPKPDEIADGIRQAMQADDLAGTPETPSSSGDTLRIVLFIIAVLLLIYAFVAT